MACKSQELTLQGFRAFVEAKAKECDLLLKWVEGHTGWLEPRELEDACLKSENWRKERDLHLHAIAMLNEFERLNTTKDAA